MYLGQCEVETALQDICDFVAKTLQDPEQLIIVAARFLIAFMSIHPFRDGNGRVGRLMVDYLFYRDGLQPPTGYMVNLAIFPMVELCWQHTPIAAANEIMKGLRNTYDLPSLDLKPRKHKAYCRDVATEAKAALPQLPEPAKH